MKILNFLRLVFRTCIVLLLAAFALKNADIVTLQFFLGESWRMPLSALMLLFLLIGVALTLLAGLGPYFRQRREINALRRELRELGPARPNVPVEVVQPPPADAAS
jgi:uncharacterized integral membrane protein